MMPYSYSPYYQQEEYPRYAPEDSHSYDRMLTEAAQPMYPYYRQDDYFRQTLTGTWSLGPLCVSWDLSWTKISVTVKLFDTIIVQGTLTPALTSIAASGNIAGFSAKLMLKADFANKALILNGVYCPPAVGCQPINLILFRW